MSELDEYLGTSSGGGWEQPAPQTSLTVGGEGPGDPHVIIGRDEDGNAVVIVWPPDDPVSGAVVLPGVMKAGAVGGVPGMVILGPQYADGHEQPSVFISGATATSRINFLADEIAVFGDRITLDAAALGITLAGEVTTGTLNVQTNLNVPPLTDSSVVDSNSTDITFNNTVPAAGVPVCGIVFTAPPSGKVWVTVGGITSSANNGHAAIIGWEMREGNVIGSGFVFKGTDISFALVGGKAVTAGGVAQIGASRRRQIGGLTPGQQYNVRTMHWLDPGPATCGLIDREISVEPVF